ncbi:MAG: alpha-glucan family phosphorylase [Candidatus Altiarchaeota archaeon]|nr:alpha-glucan family phosphorylase [Candidatus Altiarchaeota archaeon]
MEHTKEKRSIAYFSMEIGLEEGIPTYSGGLGILAGDFLKSCADIEINIVGVTLINGRGFFSQTLDASGNQKEEDVPWNPREHMKALDKVVTVPVENRRVHVKAWLYELTGLTGHTVPVILLDTGMIQNSGVDRDITDRLYRGNGEYRLKQEIVLGMGGVRMLEGLGYRIQKFHMNEGHSSLLAVELLRKGIERTDRKDAAAEKVRNKCVFTTHTPVEAGHDKFPYALVERLFQDHTDAGLIREYGGKERLNMTLLGFNLSGYINGVAKKHAKTSKSMFPAYAINAVTNGVHHVSWTSEEFAAIYDRYMKDWKKDPFLFRYAVGIPDKDLWNAHMKEKRKLIDHVNREYSEDMDPDTLTIGFARRMTEYKRPTLIFSDIKRLKGIAKTGEGIQLIFSGKAHPEDAKGKTLIKELIKNKKELEGTIKTAFIQDYGIGIAKRLVSGVDLWLNTPKRPHEASGTSGMKATLNGVINLSVLDGWWIEGHIEDVTGWAMGGPEEGDDRRDAKDLYEKLNNIARTYYEDRKRWICVMRNAIALNASFFNSQRMVQQYMTNAYWD